VLSTMIKFYVTQIKLGNMTIDNVPKIFKEKVQKELDING